ncbi:MAG: TIR domain-containing protein [Clostridia bacterium]|nr:TIR domain-containing protein [Clostridia bacterium]
MAVLKCKMCGGDIELSADKTIGVCDSCGSTTTFPKVDDEQRANMFNRGNHFRRSGEFDKALAVYERIVQENEDDAEAHWCCALCRFGIEYVEDPNTFEFIPTCHRASFDSFLEDVDYLAAVEHSDGITRRQYQKDAAKIAEVQRGILATSQNEEPFDVFICYKESENDGSRTRDSLLAQDIYYQLTEQGRRVFFSRITLEDKAGTEYEPYIFAALNSAKVMILVTTSAEHANAVWVKNEWSRFLSLMRKDRSKLLLPCYRDMDPYDLPEALSVLQSYDMSKIGFIQDLTRGVNKVLDASKPKETVKETVVVQPQRNTNAAPLLERAFMFLEDGDWDSANEYCEKVLDIEPKNAEAYLGKLMAELKVKKRDDLKDQPQPFDDRNNYHKIMRFGSDAMKQKLAEDAAFIKARNENARREGIYEKALAEMRTNTEEGYRTAYGLLNTIPDHRDAQEKIRECRDWIYQRAIAMMYEETAEGYLRAGELLSLIADYRDAGANRKLCADRERDETIRNNEIYDKAIQLLESNQLSSIQQAVPLLESIRGWKDADKLLNEDIPTALKYIGTREQALRMLHVKTEENLIEAIRQLRTIESWGNTRELIGQSERDLQHLRERKAQNEEKRAKLRQELDKVKEQHRTLMMYAVRRKKISPQDEAEINRLSERITDLRKQLDDIRD